MKKREPQSMTEYPRKTGEKVNNEEVGLSWELKVATEVDVDRTVEQLSDHMDDQQRATFRVKLQRYVRKPDRALILAVNGRQVLGLVCVIDQMALPSNFQYQKADYLRNFAFGSQILVHPSVRKRGIGSSLHLRAEHWARERGRAGHWLITHRKADWYQLDFGYKEIGRISAEGVEKIVMSKEFE